MVCFLMVPNLVFRRISTPSTPHLHPQSSSAWKSSCPEAKGPHSVTVYSRSHLSPKHWDPKVTKGLLPQQESASTGDGLCLCPGPSNPATVLL